MTKKEFNEIKILINALAGITECKSTVQKCNNAIVILEQNKQLLLHNVVVPKGTLCKCKKEFIVYNDREGLNVCTLCGESKLA